MKHPTDSDRELRNDIRTEVRAGRMIRLWRRRHAFITVYSGNGPRFAELFRQTWKRMPRWATRLLLAYWEDRMDGLIRPPFVELVPYPLGGRRTFATTSRQGMRYHFRSEYVDAMPDDVVQDLVAHELAHGVQSADGIRCVREYSDGRADFVCADGSPRGGRLDIELDADEMMDSTGGSTQSR